MLKHKLLNRVHLCDSKTHDFFLGRSRFFHGATKLIKSTVILDGGFYSKRVNFLSITGYFEVQLVFAGWQDLAGVLGEENTFN